MNRISRLLGAVGLAAAVLLAVVASPAIAATTTRTANFVAGSPLYVLGGTSGPFNTTVKGNSTFQQVGTTITAHGHVEGLRPNTAYVTVAYKDDGCLPTPGLTAFPSAAFTTNAVGKATFTVTVNPMSINPVGTLSVPQIKSISIRQVLINSVAIPYYIPNNPYPASPTIPNVAYVEACDLTLH